MNDFASRPLPAVPARLAAKGYDLIDEATGRRHGMVVMPAEGTYDQARDWALALAVEIARRYNQGGP